MQKGIKKLLSVLIVFGMVVSTFTSSVTPTYGEDIKEQPTTAETPSTEEANQTTESNVPQKTDTSPSEQTTTEPQATTEVETTPQEEPTTQTATNEEDTNTTSNEEEKVSYPAQNFSKSAGKITVHVSAVEGIFPEGTTMTITPVSSTKATQIAKQTITGNEKVEDAIGVDITFYDSSGKEIEPKDGQGVQVNMQLNESLKGKDFTVVHQEDNGTVQTVSQNASAQGATFQANAFSIYVITGIGTEDEDPAVATYQFHDANGDVYSTQKVKNGEILTAPETPEKEGNIFKGWATSQGASEANFDITQPVSVEKTSTVDLYPVFSQKLYVFFLDKSGRVINTKEGAPGDVITTSDVSVPLGSEESVTGWYTDASLTNPVSEVTLEDHNVTLYPKIEKGHYLYFSTGDNASYIEPEFVAAGKQTQKPNDPTRPGYTFKGWSTTEGGSVNYHFGQTLSDNQTIYAVWEANKETKYTVIYWWQNANDNKYSFHESKIEKGTTGSQITFEKKSYDGFNLNSDKTNQENANKTIAGDGSTIVNVYYDRQVYTIKFYHYVGYVFNGSWQEYTDRQITAKYGANIADQWPSDLAKIWGTTRQGSSADKPYQSGISTMPLDGDEFYKLEENGRYTMNLNYYIEGLNDDQYVLDHTDRFRSDSNRWSTTSEDHYDIEGFTYTGNVEDGSNFEKVNSNTYEVNFRYKRNSYAINFINGDDTKTRTETYKYEADISNVDLSTTPDRPDGVPEGYKFVGWYDNELGVGDKVTLPSKMPAHNITLYAKWEAPTYIATVHTTIDGNGTTIPIEVTYGEKIDPSSLPTVKDADGKILSAGSGTTITLPENTEWIGWSTKDGDKYINFNLNTKIYNDIELYPYYLSTKKYKVTYDVNGGTGSVADSKEYASGSYADIQSASGLKAPNKKSFLYWSTKADGTGTTYYPDDKIKVTEDITLYAIYGDPAKTTSLTYHSNYPSETGLNEVTKKQSINGSEDLENNASFKAYSNTEAGMQAPDGYYFDGWKDSKGQSIQAGQTIGVDTTDSNDLYAQWKKKESLLIEVKGNNDSHVYDGENHSVSGYTLSYTVDGKTVSGLPDGLTLNEDAAKERKATGKDVGTYKIGLTEGDFKVTGSDANKYTVAIKVTDGQLLITKRAVHLKSESATKTYDGTPLTRPDVDVTGAGFVKGEVSDIKATGTITKVGSVTNTITYTKNDSFKADNYDITKDEGTLTITKNEKEIVVTAKNATKTYDGKALTEEGYEVAGLPEGYTPVVETSGSITDAGSTENKITSVKIMKGKEDVTDQFKTITKNNGTLTVNKRNVTLTSQSATKQYDGTALTAPEVKVTGDGFVEGEVSDITATGTITKVGNVKNEITYTTKDGFKAGNYDITKKEGTLVITPNTAEITVTAKSAEKTYDGKALSEDGYDVAGLPEGFKAEATTEGSITNVGSTENKITSVKIMKDDKDVTNQFNNIKTVNGTLTVNPRKVTLTSESKSKAYDGTELTAPEVKVTGDGFVDSEVSDIKATGSITKVGSVTNTIAYTKNDSFKADNYDITKDEGTLTITKNEKEIVVTAKNATKTYDGTPLTEKGSDVTGLPEGYTPVVETSGSITDAGSTENKITSVKIMKDDEDVTDQFKTITKNNGTLTVNKRNVTLTSQSATKQYDGTALTAPDVTVTGDGFVDGEVSDVEAIGTITKVGSVTNTITYTTGKAFNENNYTITKNEGKLKITQNAAEITVKASSAEKIYDGTALVSNSYKVTGLPEGFKVETSVTGQRTNVGTVDNVLGDVVIKKDGQDVTNQFSNVSKENGKLTVKKRTVNLKSESATKTYDGTALTRPDVTVTGDGFLNTEVTNVRAIGSITKVGKVSNTIDYDANSRFDVNNYDIHISEGTLEITPYTKQISVTAKSAEKTYDGKALTEDGYDVAGLPKGFRAEATTEGSITDVGSIENKITSIKIMKGDEDVTDQFTNIKTVNGTLTVTKRTVNLKSESDSKKYDGTALTSPKVTVTGDGFVEGEVSDIKATGSITKVGSTPNTITYTENDGFKADNYTITKDEGTLTITQSENEIVVTAKNATKTYDGKELSAGYDITGLPEGYTAEVTTEGSITDVGSTENKIASVKIMKGDEDVTDQFKTITKNNGTLTVTKRNVTLTSQSATKQYDGTALTAPDVTVTGDGFVEGEVSDITATGSITKVGNVKNEITYTTKDGFKADNYDITKKEGTLTITANANEIVVTAKDADKKYDGKELSQSGYDVTGLPEGFTAIVKTSGSIIDAGKADNVIKDIVIKKGDDDVTDQFSNIKTVNGTLTVNPRKVTLTSESASKTYDGTPLTSTKVSVTGDGFVEGEVSDIKATGSQTYVGSSKNDITYKKEKNFKDKNYIITLNKGKLTVTDKDVPSDLVVTKKHDSKTYKVGDTITFTIEVTNIYDKAKTITIVEQDDVQITGEKVFTNVAPGATVKTTATHVVTKEDVDAKEYKNVVTAKFDGGKDFDGHDKEDQFDRLEISKTVTSTPKDGQLYRNGETISYKITVKNTGTTVAKNVNVTDDLTGLNETVDELGAGEEKSFDTTYVVTDKDVHAGHIKNVATATSDGNDPVKDEVDTPVETAKPSLIVEKTSDKDHPVKLNETIHYTVTVTNNGNVTIENVTVDDELTDNHWKAGTLKPGESKTFDTQYTVKAEDIAKGKVVNVATADGRDSTGDKPDVTPGEVINETEKSQPHLTLTKTTTSTPQNKDGYTKGETITYRIKAENDGNVELRDIKVEDPLTKDIWSIESLQPGESKTWTTSYIVTEADQVKGSVVNDVTASAKTSTGDDPVIVPGHTSDKVLTPAKVTKETKNNDTTNTGVATFGGTYAAAMLAAAGLLMSLKRRRDDE